MNFPALLRGCGRRDAASAHARPRMTRRPVRCCPGLAEVRGGLPKINQLNSYVYSQSFTGLPPA